MHILEILSERFLNDISSLYSDMYEFHYIFCQ